MDTVPKIDKEAMRRWVETWKVAGEELDRMKWDELRAMTEDDAARMLDLQHWPADELWRSPARESAEGMIEQQRIFLRAHELSTHR
ncbi:MAG: hypothetical protein PHC88_10715 [Terrimicrobiaceae bacterium]|nr:hypothetical protein [Terrimicrobiaceae bacterium]